MSAAPERSELWRHGYYCALEGWLPPNLERLGPADLAEFRAGQRAACEMMARERQEGVL